MVTSQVWVAVISSFENNHNVNVTDESIQNDSKMTHMQQHFYHYHYDSHWEHFMHSEKKIKHALIANHVDFNMEQKCWECMVIHKKYSCPQVFDKPQIFPLADSNWIEPPTAFFPECVFAFKKIMYLDLYATKFTYGKREW